MLKHLTVEERKMLKTHSLTCSLSIIITILTVAIILKLLPTPANASVLIAEIPTIFQTYAQVPSTVEFGFAVIFISFALIVSYVSVFFFGDISITITAIPAILVLWPNITDYLAGNNNFYVQAIDFVTECCQDFPGLLQLIRLFTPVAKFINLNLGSILYGLFIALLILAYFLGKWLAQQLLQNSQPTL